MNTISWRLADLLSRLLDPAERTAVQGDLLESGQNGTSALRDVCGLVARRQLALWRSWQLWLALLGVVGVSAVVLSTVAFNLRVALDHRFLRYLRSGIYADPDVTAEQGIAFTAFLTIAFFAWTWTSSFVLATLSRRALWLTGLMFYVVVLNSFLARLFASDALNTRGPIVWDRPLPIFVVFLAFLLPLSPSKILFLVAAIWGARRGLRRRALGVHQSVAWAVLVIVVTTLVVWTGGWYQQTHSLILPWISTSRDSWPGGIWHAGPWPTRCPPLLLVGWPIGYMLVTSWEYRNQQRFQSGDINK